MEIHISDLSTYFQDHIFIIILTHVIVLATTAALIINIARNWRREQANQKKLTVPTGTYMALISRDLRILLVLYIGYVLLFPLIFGFIQISLY